MSFYCETNGNIYRKSLGLHRGKKPYSNFIFPASGAHAHDKSADWAGCARGVAYHERALVRVGPPPYEGGKEKKLGLKSEAGQYFHVPLALCMAFKTRE